MFARRVVYPIDLDFRTTMNRNNAKKHDNVDEVAPLLHPGHDRNVPPLMAPEHAAAWMAQYGTSSAIFYAEHGAHGGLPPPPSYFYQGYPAPQGHNAGGPPQGPGLHSPPTFMYPSPFAPTPQTTQRPPRSQPRSSGTFKASPVSSDNNRNLLSTENFRDGNDNSTIPSIPPFGDIFSDSQPLLQSSNHSVGSAPGGYGATVQPQHQQPKVYNAPPRISNKSSVSDKATRGLPRTNSAGDFKHPLKSSGSSRSSQSSQNHRRINSDGPLRTAPHRQGSNDELPPIGHRRSSSRSRSFSTGNVKKPTHRRGDSSSSMLSNMSKGSVVSNISKSEFFGGVDDKGRVQMHFPFEDIRLVMIDPKKPALRQGHLYLDGNVGDFEQYEEYHRICEMDSLFPPQWESLDRPGNRCGCTCNNCNGCSGKKNLLPRPSYMLAVDDTVYKAVMAEIASAHSMPCGLFFCGHHDDVAHPSIFIAVVVIFGLFACMLYLAYAVDDM